jgi:Spy/CpxP family protein refolding chaperone
MHDANGGFMSRMRTVLIGVALTMGIATGAFAQGGGAGGGGGGGQGRGGRMMAMLMNGITLTDSEKTQIQAIEDKYAPQMQQFRQKMRDARQNGTPMDSASMQAMRDTNKKERDEIRAVLTPDQQSKFDDNIKSMMARRPRGH